MGKFTQSAKNMLRRLSLKTKPVTNCKASTTTAEETSLELKSQLEEEEEESVPIVIVGAGIVGLVLALALEKHCGLRVDLYEQAQAFHEDVGAGMCCYPNGLRVIRDISPQLLSQIQQAGTAYKIRQWERHDGTPVAQADETVLSRGDDEIHPIGIRRWNLQKVLYEAALEAGIQVHFNKHLKGWSQHKNGRIVLKFEDGTTRETKLLFAADGSKSQVRKLASGGAYKLEFTGTTCLMGISKVTQKERGLYLPSSATTKCHGAFYPTSDKEQCFQFHFPTSEEDAQNCQSSWGGLAHHMEQEECEKLADRLEADGWDKKYLEPLRKVEKGIKIAYSTLNPPLNSFVFGRVVLVGDSAHPPVPYLGQGAQQGLEDAGTLALLLKHFCTKKSGHGSMHFSFRRLETALKVYDKLRLPRTLEVSENGKLAGMQQQRRAESQTYNRVREEQIKREVFYNETAQVLLPATRHDYAEAVEEVIHAI